MPIIGLTDRGAAFPRIGVLRKGDEKKTEKAPGRDLTYFRFTSEDPSVLAAFESAYGKEPTAINVVLPYATADENWSAWREEWVAGGLVHRCDGQTCTVHKLPDGTYSTAPKPCPGNCKPVGRLGVIVPELRRLAFVTVLTTSLHDIMTLTENLAGLELIRGDLRGIPMVLYRKPRKVSTPEFYPKGHPQQYKPTGKRVRREKWLLTLEAEPRYVALQLAAQQAAAIPQITGPVPELEAPEDNNGVVVDIMTGEIFDTTAPDFTDAEFYDEPEPVEPPTTTAPRPANGDSKPKSPARPLDAETIRSVVRKKANWFDGPDGPNTRRNVALEPTSDKQVQSIASLFAKAMPNLDADTQDHARHDILNYLFGVTSTKSLMRAEGSALIDWLKAEEGWEVGSYAQAEVAAILTATLKDAGQLEMEMALDVEPPAQEDAPF